MGDWMEALVVAIYEVTLRALSLLAGVFLALASVGDAHAVVSVHLECPGVDWVSGASPTGLIFSQSGCATQPSVYTHQWPGAYACIQDVKGVRIAGSGAFVACTTQSHTDNVSTIGGAHAYLNCIECPRALASGALINLGRLVFLPTTTAGTNGGCSALTFNGVASYSCPTANLYGCLQQGFVYKCSMSLIREPEMVNLENYVVLGFAIMCLVAGFVFGWRAVQRGPSQ